MMTVASHLLGSVEVSVAALVAGGLVVVVGLGLIVGLLVADYLNECDHQQHMARVRRRQHG